MRADLPSGTVTFLFTDIEGSTRLLRRLGPERYAEALAEHRRVLREAFSAAGGVEVDTQGDAFFVAFPSADGAAAGARSGQQALSSGPISVRMGLHTGTPTVTDEGYVGIDVHRGARIAALAHGRQVVVSEATADLLDGELTQDLGRHRLKDFDAPAQIFQLGTGDFPPLRTPGSLDLPTPPTRFLGRSNELYQAMSVWLDREPRIMTIVGPGGAGKTRFSLELARVLADDAIGGTVFVSLAPIRDPAAVIPMIADRLGAASRDVTAISARVGEKRTHVVLDNVEQLLPTVARPIAELLVAAPGLRIVATSREPLRIDGECEFDLAPMNEPDAVALFVERACALRPGVTDSPAVHDLCRRLDHLPLAIELAAARTKLLRPEQILDRIGHRLDGLRGARDADARHATLRATIAWSHDLLGADEQQLFAQLAVFRGGWTLDAMEEVCQCDLDTMASLLDKSLVRRRATETGDDWFWMLETIREFAVERLAELGGEALLRKRQTDWLIALAERAGLRATVGFTGTWQVGVMAPEMDNVRAALEWSQQHAPEQGLMLAAYLEGFWLVRDDGAAEGSSWLESLLAAAPRADPTLCGHAYRALGGALQTQADYSGARRAYEQSLECFTQVGDPLQIANLRYRAAATMLSTGDEERGFEILEESLVTFRELGIRRGEAQVLGYLGDKAFARGDLQGAIDFTVDSARLAAEVDWPWWQAGQLGGAASLELMRGNLDAAEVHAYRALELEVQLGSTRPLLLCGARLAGIAAGHSRATRAGRLWGAVEAMQAATPVRGWSTIRDKYEPMVLAVAGDELSLAREEGRLLTIEQAAAAGG